MSYNVKGTPFFTHRLKRLVKKYPSLKSELEKLTLSLEKKPAQGTPLGKECYKIRLAIASKGKGESGGARLITHIYIANKTVYLLDIYDKSEHENIPVRLLEDLLTQLSDSRKKQ